MARYAFPIAVLVALVGGYVVGQQPDPVSDPPAATGDHIGNVRPLAQERPRLLTKEPPVGRYVPFEVGMLLDTTNGTLFRQEGNPARWKAVVTFSP